MRIRTVPSSQVNNPFVSKRKDIECDMLYVLNFQNIYHKSWQQIHLIGEIVNAYRRVGARTKLACPVIFFLISLAHLNRFPTLFSQHLLGILLTIMLTRDIEMSNTYVARQALITQGLTLQRNFIWVFMYFMQNSHWQLRFGLFEL